MDGFLKKPNLWVDSLDNPLKFFDWRKGEPNGGESDNYLEIGYDFKWNDHLAWHNRYVICEKCSKKYKIPDGYECHETDFGTVVIKAFEYQRNPKDARQQCKKDGSYLHLPVPKKDAQNKWFLNYSRSKKLNSTWLGLNDKSYRGMWRTDNGQSQSYFNWAKGEPTNFFGGEDFVYMKSDGTWNDNYHWHKHPFMCTYTIEGTSP